MAILPTAMIAGHDEAVEQHVADRLARGAARADEDGLVVGLEEQAARRDRHLAVGDDGLLVRRADEAQIDREGDDQRRRAAGSGGAGDCRSAAARPWASAPGSRIAQRRRRCRRARRPAAARPSARWRGARRRSRRDEVTSRNERKRAMPRRRRRGVRRPDALREAARASRCRARPPSSSRSPPRRRDARPPGPRGSRPAPPWATSK